MTEASLQALERLRQADAFEWSALHGVVLVAYVYSEALRQRRFSHVALGVAFWAAELLWEMANALLLHCSGHAALWTVAGRSSFVLYVGLNLEISLMFAVAPLVVLNLLPASREARVAGLPGRLAVPAAVGLLCVAAECLLNRWGVLVWSWRYWGWPHVWGIALVYIVPFRALVWAHDHLRLRTQVRLALGLLGLALAAHGLLAMGLGWI